MCFFSVSFVLGFVTFGGTVMCEEKSALPPAMMDNVPPNVGEFVAHIRGERHAGTHSVFFFFSASN